MLVSVKFPDGLVVKINQSQLKSMPSDYKAIQVYNPETRKFSLYKGSNCVMKATPEEHAAFSDAFNIGTPVQSEQMDIVKQSKRAYELLLTPTPKVKHLHDMMWKL